VIVAIAASALADQSKDQAYIKILKIFFKVYLNISAIE